MTLTKTEKANRYDSLQVAIKFMIDRYEHQIRDSQKMIDVASNTNVVYAYHQGKRDTLQNVIEDMKRWTD